MTHLNISIDDDIAKQVKLKLKGQISSICENALSKALGDDINLEHEERVCRYCGKEGVVWDGFLEVWVCNKCMQHEVRKVSIMARK